MQPIALFLSYHNSANTSLVIGSTNMARIKQLIIMDITFDKSAPDAKKAFYLLKGLELFKNQRKVCRDIRTSTDTGRSLDKIRQEVSESNIPFLSFIPLYCTGSFPTFSSSILLSALLPPSPLFSSSLSFLSHPQPFYSSYFLLSHFVPFPPFPSRPFSSFLDISPKWGTKVLLVGLSA